jgi:hypothetical protein
MAGADRTALDGLLKDVFEDFVAEGVNNSFPLRDVFKVEKVPWPGGREVIHAAHTGRNSSPMFVGEDGACASAGVQKHVQLRIDQRKMMGRTRLTWEAMEDTTRSEASFRSGKKDEMTRLIDDFAKRDEFSIATDGKGVFALIDTGSSGTTVELDAPGNIAGNSFGNRFIQKGMALATINPTTGVIRSNVVTVSDVNADGSDFTASSNPSWTENDYVVQAANTSVTDVLDNSYERAFWGLPALIDDGTNRDNYFGVSRASFPNYKSYVVASTGALSLDLMQRVADVVDQKLGGSIDLIVCHHSVRRLYIQLLEADRRYIGANLMRPDGGTAAFKQGDLTVGEVPIKAIRSVGLDQMYFLDTKKSGFVEYVSEAGKWVDEDGAVLVRDGTGTAARHAFEAWYFIRKQRYARHPGYNARLDGITGQTLVVVRDE